MLLIMKTHKYIDFTMSFAEIIKQKRKELGMSHLKLAEACGLTRPAISMIESGKRVPTIATCYKICEALGVKLSDLILEAENKLDQVTKKQT